MKQIEINKYTNTKKRKFIWCIQFFKIAFPRGASAYSSVLTKTASLRGVSTYGSVRAKTALLRKASTEAMEKEKKTENIWKEKAKEK